jgi:hypothetical protein
MAEQSFSLSKVLRALRTKFPDDPSAPSLVLSCLDDGQMYCSALRYKERYGEGKYVVETPLGKAAARAGSLMTAVGIVVEKLELKDVAL